MDIQNKKNDVKALQKKFKSLNYVDGSDNHRPDSYHILVNIILILSGFRPSFLIQAVDYKYTEDYQKTLQLVYNASDKIEYKITPQGILFYNTDLVSTKKMNLLLDKPGNIDNDEIFGKVLGYPCAGDTTRRGNRVVIHIVTEKSNGEVFSNICLKQNALKFWENAIRIKNFIETNTNIKLKIIARKL